MLELLWLILGIFGLLASAELLIWALQIISNKLGISGTFLGLTVLSIGTSLPEIGTHIIASIDVLRGIDASGVAVGTNIGSNLMQITLILGLTALLVKVYADKKFLKQHYAVMLGSIILLFLISLNGFISPAEGLILVGLYIFYLRRLGKVENFVEKVGNHEKKGSGIAKYYFYVFAGIGLLLFTANIVVNNAVALSRIWGIEESFIGAVIIGFGTALPEFATAMTALKKKRHGMSLGVLIGSNITNPLFALGIGAIISGYTVDNHILFFDIPFWFFTSVLAMVFFIRKREITKNEAILLMCSYLLYIFLRLRLVGIIS